MGLSALNSRTLDAGTLNGTTYSIPEADVSTLCFGELNGAPMNAWELNGCIFFATIPAQTVVSIEQLIGTLISEVVAEFVQLVNLRVEVGDLVVSFVQNVQNTIASNIPIGITQMVTNAASNYSVRGWDLFVSINGTEVPHTKLGGDITITKESNQNTLCEFKIRGVDPLTYVQFIDGGDVLINYFDSGGGHRLFTGVVDTPEIDLINKWITVKCSDRREELIKEKMLPLLPTIGRYAESVQGEITSVANEMGYRLETVPADVDFDAYNNPNINSWYAKATADYIFDNSDVYYREPKVTWQIRSNIINDIDIEIKYRYPRLYHYQRPFTWTSSADAPFLVSGDHEEGFSFPTVGMLKEAISGAGWRANNTLEYEESLSNYWVTYTMVQPNTMRPYIGGLAFDAVRAPMIHHLEDENQFEVVSATWQGSTRFAQTIEESYTLNVTAPQSINQFGDLTGFNNYELQADYDTNTWENYKLFTEMPEDAIVSNSSYYVDKDINANEKVNAILTAIDKAKVQILNSHRSTKVSFEVPLQPRLELKHTVELDTTPVACKSKVTKIIHRLDLAEKNGLSSYVELSVFRSEGSGSTTDSRAPSKPSDVVYIPSASITLGNHLGFDFDNLPVTMTDTWNGFVGNTIDPPTRFTERFIVDSPDAPPNLRELRQLAASGSYNIEIPNDDLDINF